MAPQVLLSTDLVDSNPQSDIPVTSSLSDINKSPMEPEEDEDEDEDIDFNPFLKGSPAEASSSLSSEIEALDLDVVESGGEVAQPFPDDSAHKQTDVSNDPAADSSKHIDEIMARNKVTLEEAATRKSRKRKNSGSQKDFLRENEICLDSDAGNDATEEDTTAICRVHAVASDDEDAICKRTRARYSLASFTLDELETFLQETDDDDDLPNVDDEEEYRKFLAAVLQGGDKDDQALLLDNGNDEDEDNDADFEIEIEEALESDIDDCLGEKVKLKGARRRPETRQRRQKSYSEGKKRLMELEKRPLRPLLPILPTTLIESAPSNLMVDTSPNIPPSGNSSSLNGFTPHQIGQLHCLIHEHMQLLIQVFSLCVLEPSKRNIATQVQGLISEMLNQRDQVLTWRDVPYPSFCFQSPYIHPSVVDEHPKYLPLEKSAESYDMCDKQREVSSSINNSPGSPVLQSCNANGGAMEESVETFQAVQGSSWLPFVGGPVLSILDVAPLKFVGKYLDDISIAVKEQMQRYVEVTSDLNSEKQPLFPVPVCLSIAESNAATANRGAPASSEYSTVMSPSPNHRTVKKTLAATIVESTKQSIALVPKRIAELSRQFFPLFNPALFPHKPPPFSVANRVLFTDAEDELLAMGLMECNTDWKAIQQRFLPCKSKHQIFVRQKNRCSSKAPDNPIKEVRKLKTSPLTEEEKARINEGLTAFKLDWMSIWKFIVPYRDPSLLPRQWRTALGLQKSYKKIDPTQREQRRIYETNRRRNKTLAAEKLRVPDKEDEHAGVPNENGEECTENNDEAYVHEAFLADWRPAPSIPLSETSTVNPNSTFVPNNHGNHDRQANRGHFTRELTAISDHSQKGVYQIPRPVSTGPNCSTFKSAVKPSTFVCSMRTYRAPKSKTTQLVRLAPSLPPVNLPSNVRVISQASFQNSQHGTPNQTADARKDITASRPNLVANSNSGLSNVTQKRIEAQQSKDQSLDQENGTEPELQMHPLLFQAPGNGHLPYYPLSSGTMGPNSFSFFPLTPHQVNIPTFQNSGQPGVVAGSNKTTSKKTSSFSLDFHPLLQRNDNVNNGSRAARQSPQFSTDLQPFRDTVSCSGATNELELEINLNSSPQKENDLAADVIEVLTPSNGGSPGVNDTADDQSLPEIVMEQEELSDSDEEEEMENVEFEREEMADSEGEDEEPDSLQVLNTQNKLGAMLNMNDPDNPSESTAVRSHESLQCRYETPETGLSDPSEDVVRSPWLSLSSQPLVSSSDAIVASNIDSTVVSHSSKSQKNSNPRGAKNSKRGLDVQQALANAGHVISSSARKQGSRVFSSLNMDAGNSSCKKNNGA